MKILSFVNQKGGAGKSTLAIGLAVAAAGQGEKVCIIDLDRQGSVAGWHALREESALVVIPHNDVAELGLSFVLDRVEHAGFTLVVIDTKGEDSTETRDAMKMSDLALVPVRPALVDINAAKPTTVALAKMGKDYAMVVNQAPPSKTSRITTTVMTRLAHDGLVLPISIAARIDHQHAYAIGQGAVELDPTSKAAEEIGELWAWCRKRLTPNEGVSNVIAA